MVTFGCDDEARRANEAMGSTGLMDSGNGIRHPQGGPNGFDRRLAPDFNQDLLQCRPEHSLSHQQRFARLELHHGQDLGQVGMVQAYQGAQHRGLAGAKVE
jgi:hypothetical protein